MRPDRTSSNSGLILSPPGVRKREPVQRIATWLKMRLSFPRNTRSPVNQCPEQVKKQSLYAVLGTAALSLCHGRGADPRERPSHPGVRLPRFRDRNGASERSAALCQDRRDERGQGLGVRAGTSDAGDYMLRDLSTSRSHKPERARAVLLSALRKIRYAMTSSSQGA